MKILIFGNPFFAGRTARACGSGQWVDVERTKFEPEDTLFIEAGALIRPFSAWQTSKPIFAVGATHEEEEWTRYFDRSNQGECPRPKSFFLSASAIEQLEQLRREKPFWEALDLLKAKKWIEPQLRNWFYPKLRVLQVVTSVQVGGAEKIALDLSKMAECLGVVAWGAPMRTVLRQPNWDLSRVKSEMKVSTLLELASKLHVDIVHTHLLGAEVNAAIEARFPLITTIHNSPQAWPRGYERLKPGFLVGCSRSVSQALGPQARTAWNGVEIKLTGKPRVSPKEIHLVAVANFRPQKRLHRLPGILRAIVSLGYIPHLTVVGQTHAVDADSKKSRALFWKVAKRVRVSKFITETHTLDVRKVLAKNQVFVSVSAFEGLSLSHLEALGAGLPIVSTAVSGTKDVQAEVDPTAYVTLPVEARSKTFAKAIIEASKLPRKNRLPKAFTSEVMRRRYLWLYYSLLAKGKQGGEVWLVTNNFSMGGAQTSARRLLQYWSNNSNVRAFTLKESSPSRGTQDLIEKGIPVENIPGQNGRERALALLQRCAGERPRAIFFWNTMPAEKCLLADALPVPVIDVSPGEMYFNEMNQYLSTPFSELPIRTSSDYGALLRAVAVKYKGEALRMRGYLGIKPLVIPNGVNGIPQIERNFGKRRIFGTAARIAPHKRLEDLIAAFTKIDAPLYIAGKVEPGAETYAKKLKRKSTPNIHWLGEQAMRDFLPRLDVFVMISEPAGCPNASLEAMSSGLPLLITDVGGACEQALHGRNGWLVPARDTPAMKKAVTEALSISATRLRAMAKSSLRHSRNFSVEKMAAAYKSLLPAPKKAA